MIQSYQSLAEPSALALQSASEKERKYDRQLRLWAASGQSALESANVLLVNSAWSSGTAGIETLKNLVLPGIGQFAIFDDARVCAQDLGVNFFLDESSLGRWRSRCCVEHLLELNPEVQGDYYPREEVEESNGTLFLEQALTESRPFTLILYTQPLPAEHVATLEDYTKQHQCPLIAIHSAGLYAYFEVRLPDVMPIVETHPDSSAMTDLRLLSPWPELKEFAQSMTQDINSLDNHAHGHLPYVVVLLYYLDRWKETHDGAAPSNYAEKTAFRRMVADAARQGLAEGTEENFDEAAGAVLKNVIPPSLPSGFKAVFEYEEAHDPAELHSSFWAIARGVKKFYEKHQQLPLSGNLPDMKAESNVYIKLQHIYKIKARRDACEVLEYAQASPGAHDIALEEVELFCKNAAFVMLLVPPSGTGTLARLKDVVAQEMESDANAEFLMMPRSLLPIYVALRTTAHASPPVATGDILARMEQLVPGAMHSEHWIQVAQEVARAQGGELHTVSAVAGGMVAQEAIKVLTRQYVPINNTCVFDGISSRCQVLSL